MSQFFQSVTSGNLPPTVIETITGNDGIPESAVNHNFNIVTANSTPQFKGTAGTETLDFALSNLLIGVSGSNITTASSNVSLGAQAMPLLSSGQRNVGIGGSSLHALNTGIANVSIGTSSGTLLTSGQNNTLIGDSCGASITTSTGNTAIGSTALEAFTTGGSNNGFNVAIGDACLTSLTTGIYNTVIGTTAASAYTGSESNNICIAAPGVAAESNVLRLGTTGSGQQQVNKSFVAAITGVTVSASAPVAVDSNGQLSSLGFGTATQVLTSGGPGVSPSWSAAASGTVTSVSGTTNRITSTGGTAPVIDIDAAYVGQTSITTLGTVNTGTWNATAIATTHGGTGLTAYTTGDTLYTSATNVLSALAIGSTGNILTVAGGIPSWAPPATFSRVNIQTFTSSGTYTPTSGMKYCIVELIGGGGGGGGAALTSAAQCAAAGGGAGGQYARMFFSAATIGASQTVTVGTGGTAGAATPANGGTGVTSVFGAFFQASGGNGGALSNATTTMEVALGGAGSATGGGGTITTSGSPGGLGIAIFNVTAMIATGAGGASALGGGGVAKNASAAGATGLNYGGGGSGAGSANNGSGSAGGAGAPGICIVTEFI